MPEFHPDETVNDAIIKLCDALCSFERATSIESVLIVREKGRCFRAASGKPGIPDDVTDEMLMATVR